MTTITSRQIAFIEKLQADKAYIAQFDYNAPSYRSATLYDDIAAHLAPELIAEAEAVLRGAAS